MGSVILAIREAVLDRPGRRSRRSVLERWRLRVAAAVLALVAMGIREYPTNTDLAAVSSKQDTVLALQRQNNSMLNEILLQYRDTALVSHSYLDSAISDVRCDITAIEKALQEARLYSNDNTNYREMIRDSAVCVWKTDLLETALDSGIVLAGMGRYTEAVTHFQYAIMAATTDSTRARIFYYRAIAYHDEGERLGRAGDRVEGLQALKLALHDYDSALALNGSNTMAWLSRGHLQGSLGNHVGALESFDSALSHDRDFVFAWSNKAKSLSDVGKYDEAVASCDSALTRDSCFTAAWVNRGTAFVNKYDYSSALHSFERALNCDSTLAIAWCGKANQLTRLQRIAEAQRCYDTAVRFKRKFPDAWHWRGDLLFRRASLESDTSLFDSAIASYDSAIVYRPGFANAWTNRAVALTKLGRQDEVIASCDSAIKYHGGDTDLAGQAYLLKATALNRMRHYTASLLVYDSASALIPYSAKVWGNKASALYSLNRLDEALRNCDKALELDPVLPAALGLKEEILKRMSSK